jgi:hypothetical protein
MQLGTLMAALTSGKFTRSVWTSRIGISLTLGLALLSIPYTRTHADWLRSRLVDDLPCLASAIDRHSLSGNFFSLELNDALLYRFPGVRVNHTWEYISGPQLWAELQLGSLVRLYAHLDRYHVDVVVLNKGLGMDGRTLIPGLVARGWALVHMDNEVILLVPQRSDTARLIAREGYRWHPWSGQWPTTGAQALELLEEAERAIRHCPQAGFAWSYKAYALRYLGFYHEAAAAERHVEALEAARGVR